jgi:hypothetical protein
LSLATEKCRVQSTNRRKQAHISSQQLCLPIAFPRKHFDFKTHDVFSADGTSNAFPGVSWVNAFSAFESADAAEPS